MCRHKKRRSLSFSKSFLLALAIAVPFTVLLAVFAYKAMFHIHYVLPGGGEVLEPVLRGGTLQNAPELEIDGYNFVGWESESGEFDLEDPVSEDEYLTARLMPALDTGYHLPYLFADENGFILPDGTMTRGEAARILYELITVPPESAENFSDVAADAPYSEAAAALKALEVVSGDSFRPEDPVTLRELLTMFVSFYPQLGDEELRVYDERADPEDPDASWTPRYLFIDIPFSDRDYASFCTAVSLGWIDGNSELSPDEPLTRAEAAGFINRVLGRGEELSVGEADAGRLIDLSPDHPLYAQVLEAAVPHEPSLSAGAETWLSSVPFESDRKAGLFFIGTQMYCVGEDGYLVRDGSYDGFDFGSDGRFTSGMPELDELVQQALGDIVTDGMTGEEKLRAAFEYTVHSFTYTKGNYHKRGKVDWAEDEAYTMLSQGHSNCYGFAAVFYQLARALGEKPILISGLYGDNYVYHAWVEFEIDGKRYLCDPEVEWTYLDNPELETPDMFMMTPGYSTRWGYTK